MNTCVYRKHSSSSWLTSDTLSDDADLRVDNYIHFIAMTTTIVIVGVTGSSFAQIISTAMCALIHHQITQSFYGLKSRQTKNDYLLAFAVDRQANLETIKTRFSSQ